MNGLKGEWWGGGRREMLGVLFRVLVSLTGGAIMFTVWLTAVLAGMPRPPVPPSFAFTLTEESWISI